MHRRHNSLTSSTAYSASAKPSMTRCFRWSVIALIGLMLAGGIGCAPNATETQRDATPQAAATSATTSEESSQTPSPASKDTKTQRAATPRAAATSSTTSEESSQNPSPASDAYSDFRGSGSTAIDVGHGDAGRYAISVVIDGSDRRLARDAWKLEIFRRPGNELVLAGSGLGVPASWRGEMLIDGRVGELGISRSRSPRPLGLPSRLHVGDDASWQVTLERIGDLPPPGSRPEPTPASTTAPQPTPAPTSTAAAPTPTPTPTPTATVPTPTPTPTPTAAAPSPTPTPTPTAAPPTPTATPAPTAVAATPTPAETATAPSQPTSEDGRSALERWDTNGNGRITCAEAEEHGIAPVHRDHPAYAYMDDRDNDGVVCE